MRILGYLALCLSFFISSCQRGAPSLSTSDRLLNYVEANAIALEEEHSFYVPAYSNLHYYEGSDKSYFTVVLSLRNTDPTASIYFTQIDYLDSKGELLRHYLHKTLVLGPMESAEFIVEKSEKDGGAGANFIVTYGAETTIKNQPLIETIMIGSNGNHGFAFKSEAQEIKF